MGQGLPHEPTIRWAPRWEQSAERDTADVQDSVERRSCSVSPSTRAGEEQKGICMSQPKVNTKAERPLKQNQMRIIRRERSKG